MTRQITPVCRPNPHDTHGALLAALQAQALHHEAYRLHAYEVWQAEFARLCELTSRAEMAWHDEPPGSRPRAILWQAHEAAQAVLDAHVEPPSPEHVAWIEGAFALLVQAGMGRAKDGSLQAAADTLRYDEQWAHNVLADVIRDECDLDAEGLSGSNDAAATRARAAARALAAASRIDSYAGTGPWQECVDLLMEARRAAEDAARVFSQRTVPSGQ